MNHISEFAYTVNEDEFDLIFRRLCNYSVHCEIDNMINGFTNATDAADYLVNHGVPFRDAHGIIGRIVLYCLDKQMPIDDMSLEELKQFSPVFEEDVYDAISMETCVNKRLTIGAPGEEAMKKVIAIEEAYLEKK